MVGVTVLLDAPYSPC